MLVSTHQMSRAQSLNNYYPAVSCSGKLLEHVTTGKILGVHIDEHLTWAAHVTVLLSSCYAALAVFPKLHNLALYHVRKQLVESLVMSKLDYRCYCLLSPSRIPNEMAAKSSNNFRGLRTWAVSCSGKLLERITIAKILGVDMDEHARCPPARCLELTRYTIIIQL